MHITKFFVAFFIYLFFSIVFPFADIYVKRYKVDNAKIFVFLNPSLNLSSVGFVVTRGARNENPKYYGITHLWEHLFFRNSIGSKRVKDVLIGMKYNATTYNDYISFYAVGDQNKALKTFLFSIFNPNFNVEDFELEKNIVITELAMKNFSFPNIFRVYTNPTGGRIETLNNITYEVMLQFLKEIKREDLCYFVAAKDKIIDLSIFEEFYGSLPADDEEFRISLDSLTENEIYQNYKDYRKYVSSIDFDIFINEEGIWIYHVSGEFTDQHIFFNDMIANNIDQKFSKDLAFKRKLKESWGINNLEAFAYPQEYENALVIFLESNMYDSNKERVKEYLVDVIRSITYQDFRKTYYSLYLDLLDSFSDSWKFCQIIPFFVYNQRWQILNYYVRGCRD